VKIAFIGASGTGKSTLARFIAERFNLPINPVGSRSVAKEMGFVDPVTGEGRPYDVDRAHRMDYKTTLNWQAYSSNLAYAQRVFGVDAKEPIEVTAARYAINGGRAVDSTTSCRPLFQQKLAEAKIAWETRRLCRNRHDENQREDSCDVCGHGLLDPAFVTDRTPLDDMAYALLHCPGVVTEAFRDRAYAHTRTYDLVFYCPLAAGQWLGDDAARVGGGGGANRAETSMYHWRCDVLLQGLLLNSGTQYDSEQDGVACVEIGEHDLHDRKTHVVASIEANMARNAR